MSNPSLESYKITRWLQVTSGSHFEIRKKESRVSLEIQFVKSQHLK